MMNTVIELTQKSGCYSGTGDSKFQQKVNILLVENNSSNQLTLEQSLNQLEHNLVSANSIEAASYYLSIHEFAVILLDMEMSGVDELANATFLRKYPKNHNTPMILLTTSSNLEQVVLKGSRMGTVDYLLKPLVPELLLAKVSVFVSLFVKTLELAQAEEAVLACGVRLSGILDNSSDAVILVNSAHLITIFNREAERIFGYTASQVLGQPIDILFPDCAANQQFQQIFVSFRADTSLDKIGERCEIIGCRQDGTKFPSEASMFQLELVNGNYFTIILRDVSDRKATEAALRKIEANFQAFMNHSPLLCWITDSNGQFVYCNRSFENWCERSVLEVIGKTIFDLYPLEIAQQQLNCIKYITSTGNASELNESILNSNGKVYEFLTYQFPLFDANGQTLIGGVAVDLTERKQAESDLLLRNQQLLTLHKISEIALNTESLETAARETVTEISLATCFPVVAIELYNRDRHVMEFIGVTGIPALASCDNLEVPINQTLSGTVVLTGQPLVKLYQPEETTVHSTNPILKQLNVQTFVCQPMLVNQQVIGTLSLAHPERIQPDASFLRWIASLANFVASLVERKQVQQALQLANSQLNSWVKELEIRNREIASLGELSDILQACVSVEEAHQALARLIQHLFPDVSGAIFVLNREKNLLEAVAAWGNADATTELFFEAQDCWGLRRGRLHLIDANLLCIPCHHRKQKSYSQSSSESLCIPMMAQGEALGVLYLSSDEPGKLKAKQQFGVTTAEHIAVGLANLRLHEALKQQSICDPLTGLFNRRYLEDTLEREIHRAKRQQSTIGIVMIDIDYFKRFNDTFGHDAGDAVLQELAAFLKKHIRDGDIACRYGGEEMMLILPLACSATTLERAELIREGVKHLVLQHHDRNLDTISLSLGVACYPEHGLTGEAVMKAADAALYCAKQEGRDRVCVAQP
ncbi:diguanylate cyclase [Scytonema sp. NUACC26]|uniref:diguanylate cyclase n=1 Tax=Scytonema sp. NUACC26 TaxID=3140176 RepID=UPI0034DBAF43